MSARVLTIMGSGETSPTMVATHREVFSALEPEPVPAVLVDTPFGFQENADELTARAIKYFAVSLGRHLEPATLRSRAAADPAALARFEGDLRAARFVFAGPGSPTYAVEQWRSTQVGAILADKLLRGGAVTFASAAAATLGRLTLPVYEIYKVGREPHWAEGLDVLGALGIAAVVIPHFDNAEGGTHDTRYCYMGRRRLEMLEQQLPAGTSVIGVDEHTACVVDLAREEVRVTGRGMLTVRRAGRESVVPAGTAASLSILHSAGAAPVPVAPSPATGVEPSGAPSLGDTAEAAGAAFAAAVAQGDAAAATDAILALEQAVVDWSADPLQSDATDRARSALRSLIVRLGNAAADGLVDARTRFAPYVEALLAVRTEARARGDWDTADAVRDRLAALGVEVRDGRDGSDWEFTGR